jgi:hypothetical protein
VEGKWGEMGWEGRKGAWEGERNDIGPGHVYEKDDGSGSELLAG